MRTLRYTTGVLTTAVLIYALGAGITAGAGTRLFLQWLLEECFKLLPWKNNPLSGIATLPSFDVRSL